MGMKKLVEEKEEEKENELSQGNELSKEEKELIQDKLDQKQLEQLIQRAKEVPEEAKFILELYDRKNDRLEVLHGEVQINELVQEFVAIIPLTRVAIIRLRPNYYTINYSEFDDEYYFFSFDTGWVKFY